MTVTAVSAGGATSLAVGSNGSIYSWGDNDFGDLGDGSMTVSSAPVQVSLPGGTTATAVAEGGSTSLAIATVGTALSTTTSLTASPDPTVSGQTVKLTATEVAASGSIPAGSVQFEVSGTGIGSPVPVNAGGVATTTTTFASAGLNSLTAVFMPADPTAYAPSTGALTLRVYTSLGTVPLAVNVPSTGVFALTVDTTDMVNLAVSGSSATAATTSVTVSDTRNTFPGWSVSGQDIDWIGSGTAAGATISGNQLGWTPTSTGTLPRGVTLGSPVSPANPGLGSTPAVLASAPPGADNGYGTTTLGANLTLLIPQTPEPPAAGPYTAGLTISAVASGP